MNKANAKNLLRQFNFKDLFLNELGWDDYSGELTLKVGEGTVALNAVAEKRGMAAYLCTMPGPGKSYDYQTRCRIEIQLAKSVREHLVIYMDTARRFQTWQWVKREPSHPIARREHTYTVGQSGEALLQKLEVLEVKIEHEEELTLFGITTQARKAFDVDRVTKRFYDRFKTEHAAFLKQIDGIDDEHDREWYASITLNRLKFVYFIQKKGFLDQDKDYLRHRLAMVQKTRPKTKFLSFYRAFLIKLFHDGLGSRERTSELRQLLGTIPYLNGGIFAVHPLEEKHTEIDIPDKAFEKVFDFFDQYRWHLDERPLRADDEINPDVLGYIFEKYINQKQMGAYYTKEDITEYIAKNCIVPFIFDRVESEMKKIGKDQEFHNLFKLLANDPDRYIYAPVKHGVALPLPKEIEDGVDITKPNLIERRAGWNRPAPSECALPTETWREVVTRRQRYAELRATLTTRYTTLGINDLITLNLNIRQFAQDCIENTDSPDLLWAFWKAIEEISVLDLTCGSGAFLFAALNVLEPLYEGCLDRMKAFMLEWSQATKVPHPNFYEKFASVIARVEKHANEKYFIYKSIIIRNLYGVDIMDEAVEICKLRLFLKLAAQIEPDYDKDNLGIEPLPDIDFNIRAGNTLIGFATEKQAKDVIQHDLLAYNTVWPEVQRDAKEIAELFALFRQQQTEIGGNVTTEDKDRLREKLAPLEDRLNAYLAGTCGVTKKNALKEWVASHKPFHWFIEFYEIMAKGGFDVIIGNPPYVEYSKVKSDYTVRGYDTESCGNLYAFVVERNLFLCRSKRSGMIIPSAAFGVSATAQLRNILKKTVNRLYVSYFSGDAHPSTLFEGVKLRLSIYLSAPSGNARGDFEFYTTPYMRWYAEERSALFSRFAYTEVPQSSILETFPKCGSVTETQILAKLQKKGKPAVTLLSSKTTNHYFYYHNAPVFFIRAMDFVPHYESASSSAPSSNHFKTLFTQSMEIEKWLIAVMNSTTFYMWFTNYSANRDLTLFDIVNFPLFFDKDKIDGGELGRLIKGLMEDLKRNSVTREYNYTTGKVRYQEFYMRKSKYLIDEIDRVLAKHYGFTEEELDFIINYDIKYRMGKGEADEDEE
jgi:hypothetical protein